MPVNVSIPTVAGAPVAAGNPIPVSAPSLGAPADAEAAGDGSIIGLLKRLRTLLSGVLTVSGSAAAGSAPTNPPLSVSGVDSGGLKRHLLTDTAGAIRTNEAAYTPVAPSQPTTLTTGGTAQTLCNAGEVTRGGWVKNPASATESIFVTIDGTAPVTTVGGSVFEVLPGETFPVPPLTTPIKWVAATTGHKISAWVN